MKVGDFVYRRFARKKTDSRAYRTVPAMSATNRCGKGKASIRKSNMDQPKISMSFSVSDNYAQHLAVVLASVPCHNRNHNFVFHVLHRNITPESERKVKELEAMYPNCRVEFHKIDASRFEKFHVPAELEHVTQETYYRYILPEVLVDEDRTIYSDVDVLCVGDLKPLWELDLKGNILAAVSEGSDGMFNILEYCRKAGVNRVMYMQTTYDIWNCVLRGEIIHPDTKQDYSYTGDHAVYVISKNAGMELLEHYHQEYGLGTFVFRFPTIYNYSPFHYYYPGGVKTLRPVYRMIENAMQSKPIEIWGDPNNAKDMVYVADCSQMICKAIEADRNKGFYNVGTGIPVTLEEQVRTIIEVFSPRGNPSQVVYCPEKKCGGFCRMDIENAKLELGYKPQYSCKDLFEAYKEEMRLNRFAELLMR